jgi:hypothetical protein
LWTAKSHPSFSFFFTPSNFGPQHIAYVSVSTLLARREFLSLLPMARSVTMKHGMAFS